MPRHATPRHATPHDSAQLTLKQRLKKYKLIRYPYNIFIRPIRRTFGYALSLLRVARGIARRFLLSHDLSRKTLIKIAGYTACQLSTVYDYCKEHDGIIRVYDDSLEYPARPLCRTREEFERNIFAEPVMRPSYYIYASRMRDAIIFGYEDLILTGGQCLSDRKN